MKGKVSVVRRNVMAKKRGSDPRMSRRAIAALDLPFLVFAVSCDPSLLVTSPRKNYWHDLLHVSHKWRD